MTFTRLFVVISLLALTLSRLGAVGAEEGRSRISASVRPDPHSSIAYWQPRDDLPEVALHGAAPLPAEQDAEPAMTLEELEGVALANNPTLVQAAMRLRAAQYRGLQVGLYPNPVIGYSGDEMGDLGTAGKQGAFFGQKVVTAGKLRLNRATAGQAVLQAQHALRAQQLRVLSDVRAAYYEVLIARRTVRLNEKLVAVGDDGLHTSEQLMAAKEVGRVEVLQASVEADAARLSLTGAQNRSRAVWQQLATVAGMSDLAPCRLIDQLEDELPELSWQETLERLLAASPELAKARAGVVRARCALQRECAEAVPNLDLQISVHHDNTTADTLAGVEVGLPIPVFNRNQGNIRKARAELVAAIHEVKRVELDLQQRLAVAFERYCNARQQVDKYTRSILPNAQTNLELVRSGYRQGEFDYLTMLTAQRTYFRASLAYLGSLRELWLSSATIEGMLLRGSISRQTAE